MITNFEKETSPLSEEELLIADMLIRSLSKVTKSKPVTTSVIVDKFNNSGLREHLNISCKLSDIRLRKIINHIRSSGMLPILSNSKGYFVSYERKDIIEQIDSLNDRANAIMYSAKGLEGFLK
jgi:hypothetical protein